MIGTRKSKNLPLSGYFCKMEAIETIKKGNDKDQAILVFRKKSETMPTTIRKEQTKTKYRRDMAALVVLNNDKYVSVNQPQFLQGGMGMNP